MIRADRFALTTDDFAAERKAILDRSEDRLAEPVRWSIMRMGLPNWEDILVSAALDVFDETARSEVDEWTQIIDDMRDEFERLLRETLLKTKREPEYSGQAEAITRWVASMAVNAGTEAATTADPDPGVGLEWITMTDSAVRDSHREAHGQVVPTGQPFSIEGYELTYPGEPSGPPSIWISCRCLAQPTKLTEMAQKTSHGHPGLSSEKEYPLAQKKLEAESSEESQFAADEDENEELEDAPEIPEEEAYPEVQWHAVLAPEGVPSGDKRMFAKDSLTNRDLPLPMKWMPADDEGHKGSVVAARIDRIFRDGGLIKAEGIFDYSEHGYEALRQVAEGMIRGVSVDVDSAEAALDAEDDDLTVFSSARIASATMCAIPAFSQAYIAIGPWEDQEEADTEASGETGDFAISEKEWDGSASRYDEAQWHKACIVHTHEGGTPETKSECKFPIKEPNGDLSRAGVHAAASRLSSGNVSGEQLSKAKASLRTAYKKLGEEPPENVTASDVSRETFENVPGVKKDGTPPKCDFCDNPSTQYVLWAEGMAYVPACDEHISDAKAAIDDPDDIDRIGEYSQDSEAVLAQHPQLKFDRVPQKTKDGGVGTLGTWHDITHLFRSTTSTTDPSTTNAGSGPVILTDQAMAASPSVEARMVSQTESRPTDSSTSAASDQSRKGKSSTTPATTDQGAQKRQTVPTADASTRSTSNQSSTAKMSHEETPDTGGAGSSAGTDSTTSRNPNLGTSGLSMEFSDGRVVSVTSTDDENGIVKLSDGIVLARERYNKADSTSFDTVPRITRDGPGWVTDPKPTKRITSYWVTGEGAALIGWNTPGDFNRCRTHLAKYVQKPEWLSGLCSNLHYRALGTWPGQHGGRTEEMTTEERESMTASVSMVDAEHDTLSADWFRNPELGGPTPFTVTEEGRVFGHLATWDMCHIGIGEECKTAPHSATDYAYFLTGEVFTDAGPVAVGQVTMGAGHADGKSGLKAAVSHYDSTSAAVADVTVGEDGHGIWVAGALRPDVDDSDKRSLRAAVLSGDWRGVRKASGESQLEMVAALAVNVPGFPVPRPALVASGTDPVSMVAAAIPQDSNIPDIKIDDEAITAALDKRIDEAIMRRERTAKAQAARSNARKFKVHEAKSRMKV